LLLVPILNVALALGFFAHFSFISGLLKLGYLTAELGNRKKEPKTRTGEKDKEV